MAQSTKGNSGRYLASDWHEVREQARRSLGKFEWGDFEVKKYDLDNVDFDRKMRTVYTDPDVTTEGSPKRGEPLSGSYNRTNVGNPARD